jgi:hypothetical protein
MWMGPDRRNGRPGAIRQSSSLILIVAIYPTALLKTYGIDHEAVQMWKSGFRVRLLATQQLIFTLCTGLGIRGHGALIRAADARAEPGNEQRQVLLKRFELVVAPPLCRESSFAKCGQATTEDLVRLGMQ